MKYFTLGKQQISKYCLGTWSLGGDKNHNLSYGDINKNKAEKLLMHAFNNGINFFDTANVYGSAEKRLGHVFRDIRNKVFIANKVGCVSFKKKLDFSKKNIKKQIDQSIKNLNTEYLDLVQLYTPDPKDQNLRETINFLNKKKKEGIIKFIGVSLRDPIDYIKLRELYRFDAIQCNFNILDQRLLSQNIMKLLKRDGVKVFARTILNFGIFTENFLKRKKIIFKKNDHRSKWNIKQILLWKNYVTKIRKLSNRSIENTCYKFCNSFDLSSLIIGATTKNHIDEAITFNNKGRLNKNEINKINRIYKDYSKNFILKPKIPIKIS
tara:strand:+ start:83 stop:1051 length:969 start_codon:yes stop_codon:yes gene_type:complete